MSAKNQFKNRIPTHKRKKELILILIIFIILISTVFVYTYIKNYPISPENFPVINIVTEEEIGTDDYVDGTFEVNCPDEYENIAPLKCIIKIRGKLNAKMPKKGYRIQLSKQISILGMREDDDWLLMAMFMDLPHMRIKLSFDLWRSLLPTNPTAILPDSEYVIVYVNRELQGLYLLAEKNDRRLFGLNEAQNNIYSSLIFQASYRHLNFLEYISDKWEQDWPNEDEGIFIKDDILVDLIPFINTNGKNGIYSKFDKNNLIDFFIFNFFIHHEDFWDKNYFLVRNTYPSKFFLIPWDFDRCYGQYLGGKSNPNKNPESEIRAKNYLFNRLLNFEDFKGDTKERWFLLRDSIWTEEFILDMLSDMYEKIKAALEIDTNKWYPLIFKEGWNDEVNEAVEDLFDWIPKRLEFCDTYFNQF